MAHQATDYTPTALASTSADQAYFIRNTGEETVYISTKTTAPDKDNRDAFPVPPGGDLYSTPETGESIFVWSKVGFSEVVYEEAV